MKIQLNSIHNQIMDLINILALCHEDSNKDEFQDLYKQTDKNLIEDITYFKTIIDSNNFAYKFLFQKSLIAQGVCFNILDMINLNTIDDLPNYYNSIDSKYFKSKFIRAIEQNNPEPSKKNKNPEDIVSYIMSLDYDDLTQWQYCKFLNNPKYYYNELAKFIKGILPEYKTLREKHMQRIDEIVLYFKERLDKEGLATVEMIDNFMPIMDYKEIVIIPTIINLNISLYEGDNDVLYLNIGRDFEDTLKYIQGENTIEESIELINALTDNIKFNIVECILEKDAFGKEICEATGLSKSSLSYHMEYLIARNAINMKKEGNRIYYSLNKDEVIASLNMIIKYIKSKGK